MLGILQKNGIELTNEPSEAEVLIVNTCAFIESAKEESITTVLNMADYKNSGCCRSLIVAGCLGQRYGQQLLDEMPEADAIIGTGAWQRIAEIEPQGGYVDRTVLVGIGCGQSVAGEQLHACSVHLNEGSVSNGNSAVAVGVADKNIAYGSRCGLRSCGHGIVIIDELVISLEYL